MVKIGQVSQGGTLSGHNEGKIHDTAFVKICKNCEKLLKIAEIVKIDKCCQQISKMSKISEWIFQTS